MRLFAFLLVVATMTSIEESPIFGQPLEGDTSAGLRVASTICGNCHEIGSGTSPTTAIGPKFEDIANLPSTTALSLRTFLRSNHGKMPNFLLSSTDTDNVVAYILSLRRP